MTQQKKLKQAIRTRSEKTGESYTAARRQVLAALEKSSQPSPAPEPPPAPVAPLETVPTAPETKPPRGGVSDKSIREKTGHGFDHWFAVLDAFGAADKGHTAIAAHLYNEHGVPGWHSQGIAVAYERARGLRQVNQSCAGTFQVSVTKSVPASVAEVVDALTNAERRAAWLEGADPALVEALDAAFIGPKPREVKTKGSDNAWVRYPWGDSRIEIRITGKPKGASVVADNQKLDGPEHVEERRAQWRAALEGLHKHLGG
jgi:hypothetical protein